MSFQYSLGVKRDEMRKLEEIAQVSDSMAAGIKDHVKKSQGIKSWF